jgi:hypothetical protein
MLCLTVYTQKKLFKKKGTWTDTVFLQYISMCCGMTDVCLPTRQQPTSNDTSVAVQVLTYAFPILLRQFFLLIRAHKKFASFPELKIKEAIIGII